MKSLLFILPEFYPHPGGGLATFYMELLPHLTPHFKKIKVIVGSGYTQKNFETTYRNIDIEYLKPVLFNKYLDTLQKFNAISDFKRNLAASWAMFEQSNFGKGFDQVECTDFGIGYIPWLITRELPVLIRMHGSSGQINYYDPRLDENLQSDFYKLAELCFFKTTLLATYSDSNLQFWNKVDPNLQIRKILPVYTSLAKKSTPILERNQRGVITGRLQYWKGPIVTFEAVKEAKSNIELNWYGRDMVYNSANQYMSEFLRDNYPEIWNKKVFHKESVKKEEINIIQQKAKFGLIPSNWDMFNFTCIEFMANFTPVICSCQTGASELIEDEINGFKFECDDVNGLSERIEKLLALKESEYSTISENAYNTIRNKLSDTALISKYLNVYQEAATVQAISKIEPFISEIFKPDKTKYPISTTLNNFPMKEIWSYLIRRTIKKVL